MDAEPWIRRYPQTVPPATAWRALFFPHSGGSADSCQPLAARLAGFASTAGVRYPGRAERGREPFFTDVHVLADQVAGALATVRADGPLLLFGHSLGAAVAYEVARRLPDQRHTVLVASGHPAPSRLELPGFDDDGAGDADASLTELIRSLGGADAALLDHPLLRRMFLPVIRADLRAHRRYRPGPGSAVGCRVVALMGADDPLTDEPRMQAWQRHTTAPLRVHTFSGGHFFTHTHTAEVAELLRHVMTAGPGTDPTHQGDTHAARTPHTG
ncbi:thioesterase [Streptomyces sp. ISL-12]|uniref:thioesterase II family protein n=1 Tax=Streptomyces sp. ISL-12 TaxID=2819177 RepID=UPI001BE72055|nr:alpha/beta fold hydrolase [Streptomyces sp. ISL-12]MBT2410998.1 thioesterase [Streptomyces sp. ISL-12]